MDLTIVVVSSAHKIRLFEPFLGESIIYQTKSEGPKIEPCGTPTPMSSHCDFDLLWPLKSTVL